VATLAKAGTDEATLLAAVTALGRDRAFPGYLKQRVELLAEQGGPCKWEGLNRSALTAKQLEECGCPSCLEWVEHVQSDGLPEPIREEASGTEAGEQTGAVIEIPGERPVGEESQAVSDARALRAFLAELKR
jgi:hypothetical protein